METCKQADHNAAPRQELLEPAPRDSLHSLSDDALVEVFRRLPAVDVLRLRRVCRRWRDLLLHPDVWRRREVLVKECSDDEWETDEEEEEGHEGWTRKTERALSLAAAELRAAPCADSMAFSRAGMRRCGLLALSTRCAVVRLEIDLNSTIHDDENGVPSMSLVARTVAVIRNQVRLGRLRELQLDVSWTLDFYASIIAIPRLLDVVYAVGGLERLSLQLHGDLDYLIDEPAMPQTPSRPSLKVLFYEAYDESYIDPMDPMDPRLVALLGAHAATLESVCIDCLAPCKLPVALLDACPRLRRLQCPLLADVQPDSFAGVDELTVVASTGGQLYLVDDYKSDFDRAVARTSAMLRQAALRLTALSLQCAHLEERNPVPEFLAVVAESGRASVRELQVDVPFHADTWPAVAAAIPRLPQLVYLVYMALMKDEGLGDVTPDTAPNLRRIKFYISSCLHCWLHREPVTSFLRRNRELHAAVHSVCIYGCEESVCMKRTCHPSLRLPCGQPRRAACFYSHEDKARCPLDGGHREGGRVIWVRV